MAKRISLIGAGMALVALLVAALAIGASGTTKRHFVLTDRGAIIQTSKDYPQAGSTAREAAAMRLKLGGDVRKGAETRNIEIISSSANTTQGKGNAVAYLANGSIRVKFHVTVTIGQGGSTTLDVTGRITGGTGTYRGAAGKFTGTGASAGPPLAGAILTTRSKGTISY